MADGKAHGIETEETIQTRHRKERKELQAKIQSLKSRVPKGDKKKKKEVQEEVAKLEIQFDDRQGKELQQFRSLQNLDRVEIEPIADKLDQLSVESTENAKGNKITRAQKRRNKKDSKEKEREKSIAQQEIENQFGPRLTESRKLKAILRGRNLAIYEVPSDGNCLYAAVKHQLIQENIQVGIEDMRHSTAEFMLSHPNDFMPFLSNPSSGEPLSPTEFENYCHEVASSSEAWGSQTELQALSQVYKCTIEILQADGPVVCVGEEFTGPRVVLTYHRHSYGLGEHYNSVTQRSAGSEDSD